MNNRPSYIIGVTGGSGSGKSTFVDRILQQYTRDQLGLLTMDNYYFPRESQSQDENGIKNFDLLSSIDLKSFASDLEKLKKGETITRKEYTFNNPLSTPSEIVVSWAPVILVEGIFVMSTQEIRKQLDLSIFIHARESHKLIRRIKRDKSERNYPLEDVLYRYEHHVLPSFDEFIKPFLADVDLVVNNNTGFENGMEVLQSFINSKLD